MFQTIDVEKIKAHIKCLITPPKIVSFMRYVNHIVQTDRRTTADNTIQCMRIAWLISKATDTTHSEYVIIIAFAQKLWLRERASLLRLYVHYIFIVCKRITARCFCGEHYSQPC